MMSILFVIISKGTTDHRQWKEISVEKGME